MILFTLIINIHIACKVFQLFALLLAEAFYIILPNYGSKKKKRQPKMLVCRLVSTFLTNYRTNS